MTYQTMAQIQADYDLSRRVTACAAAEIGGATCEAWAAENRWTLAARAGWAEAWEAAVAENPGEDYAPGRDDSVITDEMILDAVRELTGDPAKRTTRK